MKRILYTTLILLTIFGSKLSFSQDLSSAVDYYNNIVEAQNEVVDPQIVFLSFTLQSDNYSETKRKQQQLIKQLKRIHSKVDKTPAFLDNRSLKFALMDMLNKHISIYENNFAEVVELKNNSYSSYEAMANYFDAHEKAELSLESSHNQFLVALQAFVRRYNLESQGNRLLPPASLEQIREASVFSRDIFLTYFNVYQVHRQFLDAFDEKNSEMMNQLRSKLLRVAAEALRNLESNNGINGDLGYLSSAKQLINFYLLSAGKELGILVELVKNFDTLTKEEREKYNEIVSVVPTKEEELTYYLYDSRQRLMKKYIPAK